MEVHKRWHTSLKIEIRCPHTLKASEESEPMHRKEWPRRLRSRHQTVLEDTCCYIIQWLYNVTNWKGYIHLWSECTRVIISCSSPFTVTTLRLCPSPFENIEKRVDCRSKCIPKLACLILLLFTCEMPAIRSSVHKKINSFINNGMLDVLGCMVGPSPIWRHLS